MYLPKTMFVCACFCSTNLLLKELICDVFSGTTFFRKGEGFKSNITVFLEGEKIGNIIIFFKSLGNDYYCANSRILAPAMFL